VLKLGAYTACLHDRPLANALDILAELGLTGAEINAGGFIPTPHLPVEEVLASDAARDEYLDEFARRGLTLTGLNVNGNPLHPDPEVGPKHAADLERSIGLAARLGVRRVVAMSGLPAAHEGGRLPAWAVIPWDSAYTEALAYQWDEVAIPFWTRIDRLASDADVTVCIEMHPHNLVFNPPTLERLVERTGATHVGAEMDPSHLFWQGIDPIAAVERLDRLVRHAAAKDTRINDANCRTAGVLDDRFRPVPEGGPVTGLGGRYVVNLWPEEPSWEFVAVGRGHDADYWSRFLAALAAVDPDMAVNIEHEDAELPGVAGLAAAAGVLTAAARNAGV
jgi:sugar phosphate isomerase/epimerase